MESDQSQNAASGCNCGSDGTADRDRAVLLEAWIGQRNEWTKSIFAISSAAIAFLAAAMFREQPLEPVIRIFLMLSILAFSVSVCASLSAFEKGAELLDHLINHGDHEAVSDRLAWLQSAQLHGFVFGLLLLVVACIFQMRA